MNYKKSLFIFSLLSFFFIFTEKQQTLEKKKVNTAIAAAKNGDYTTSLYFFDQLHQPTANVLCNKAYVLKKLHRYQEAIACYKKSLVQKPNNPRALLGLSFAHLMLGDFHNGWPAYEYRWAQPPAYNKQLKNYLLHHDNLYGKTVLLKTEFGLGDTMQFIRYAQNIKNLGAYVIVESQKPLVKLLSLLPYIDEVITADTPQSHTDFICQLMSLPYIFGTNNEIDIPNNVPYLHADENLHKKWPFDMPKKSATQDRSSNRDLRVGLCWQSEPHKNASNQKVKNDASDKSIPLQLLAELSLLPNVKLYSLQKINGLDQLESIRRAQDEQNKICIFPDDFDETRGPFMDTASVMKHLDLVITIDTSVAHLAGGLGVPVFVLLPYTADWRWMLNRQDSPWYPTMKLFRQPKPGDWQSVLEMVKKELVDYFPRCNAAA